jgi:CRISPR-associated Csx2 family protein
LFNELKPDKLIVIGTPQSIWAELSKINPELLESGEVYERIWEETWEDKSVVKKETLKEWETNLKEKLNTQISLNLVDNDAIDSIVEILYKELPEKVKEVYLDITHAFRHFPLIAAFALPALKYIKAFEKLTLIYGKLAKPPEKSPVIFLDNTFHRLESCRCPEDCEEILKILDEIIEKYIFPEEFYKDESKSILGGCNNTAET